MIRFSEIINSDNFRLKNILKNCNNYLAHLKEGRAETLVDHTALTLDYLSKLIYKNNIETVLDSLIDNFISSNFKDKHTGNFADFLKTIFVKTIYFHDFGKINPNFQNIKMNNQSFIKRDYGISSDHSILSAYLYLSNVFEEIKISDYEDEYKNILYSLVFVFSHSIIKHHGSLNKALEYPINDSLCHEISDFYKCFISIPSFRKKRFVDYLKTSD